MDSDPRKPRVFIVDNESTVALTLGMILSRSGFEAECFASPEEALQAASDRVPDLLITDVVMPALSGIELAIQVRERCPECKVLVLSGQPATPDLLASARARGHDFEALGKPLDPADLLNKVHTLMNA